MKIAKRMSQLTTELAFNVLAEAQRLQRQGHDVISFAIGDPDFDTPQNIKHAAIKAMQDGKTHYAPTAGIPELRKAVADYVSRTRRVEVSPDEVIITPGAKPLLFFGILACLEEGDEALYPDPAFSIYESVIGFAGAKPVPVPLKEEHEFRMHPEDINSLLTDRTRIIIINSPHNPTGSMQTLADLEAIAEIARKHDLWVLSDEVYSRLVYDGEHFSILSLPGMKERTILVDGCSKTYSMTGWRLGFGVMNREMVKQFELLTVNSFSCTTTFIQHAAVEALTGPQESSEAMRNELKERRDLMVRMLNELPGIHALCPKGAFYIFANVTEACRRLGLKDADEFCDKLMHEAFVAVLPRSAFGEKKADETQEYVRFSYVTRKETIVEGLRRIKAWLEGSKV